MCQHCSIKSCELSPDIIQNMAIKRCLIYICNPHLVKCIYIKEVQQDHEQYYNLKNFLGLPHPLQLFWRPTSIYTSVNIQIRCCREQTNVCRNHDISKGAGTFSCHPPERGSQSQESLQLKFFWKGGCWQTDSKQHKQSMKALSTISQQIPQHGLYT